MMSKLDDLNGANHIEATEEGTAGKRAYVKPSFRHEEVFETMALACGKLLATGVGHCGTGSQSAS